MANQGGQAKANAGLTDLDKVIQYFGRAFPNLWGAIRPDIPTGRTWIVSITIMLAEEGGWLAIARGRSGDDGTPLVAFGSGPDWWAAWWNLNKTIAADKWKVDKKATGANK